MRGIASTAVLVAVVVGAGGLRAETTVAPAATPQAPVAQATAAAAEAKPVAATTAPAVTTAPAEPTTSPSAAAPAEADKPIAKPAPPPPPAVTLKVAIDLGKQRLTVSERGKVKYSWPISSGRAGFLTPTGNYRPQWAAKMWYSKKYDDAPMPHSVFFHDGFAIHATSATGRLGSPASHGCIRLSPANAQTFYKLVHKHGFQHTRIAIRGRTPAPMVAKGKPGQTVVAGAPPSSKSLKTATYGKPKPPRYGYAAPGYGFNGKPYLSSGGFSSYLD